jgi:hypothetical protein
VEETRRRKSSIIGEGRVGEPRRRKSSITGEGRVGETRRRKTAECNGSRREIWEVRMGKRIRKMCKVVGGI